VPPAVFQRSRSLLPAVFPIEAPWFERRVSFVDETDETGAAAAPAAATDGINGENLPFYLWP